MLGIWVQLPSPVERQAVLLSALLVTSVPSAPIDRRVEGPPIWFHCPFEAGRLPPDVPPPVPPPASGGATQNEASCLNRSELSA
jgi:hypothetical protein